MKQMHLWVLTLIVAGCSVLGPLPDRSRYYTVTSVAPPQSNPLDSTVAPHAKLYGLGPITLPAYLDRREIATRVSATEVTYSRTGRWAEPLAVTVETALLQNLSERLPSDNVVAYPWTGGAQVDYQIAVSVQQFEPDTSGNGLLHARWLITDPRSGERLANRNTEITHPRAAGGAGPAVALSEALGALSDEIALELQRLPPPAADTKRRSR